MKFLISKSDSATTLLKILGYRLLLLGIFLLLTSCAANKEAGDDTPTVVPRVNCPSEGDCSFEVLQKSELDLNRDPSGKIFPKINDGNKVVIRYHFKKRPVEGTADSNHSEYILFEIDPGRVELILNDQELQQVKMTYGRICYCKGASGYFPVTKGRLFVFQNNGLLQVRSEFEVKKVPQIIDKIEENLRYFPEK